jgi:hypothetical protein
LEDGCRAIFQIDILEYALVKRTQQISNSIETILGPDYFNIYFNDIINFILSFHIYKAAQRGRLSRMGKCNLNKNSRINSSSNAQQHRTLDEQMAYESQH